MATNFYGNGTNSSVGQNTIVHYYDRAGINAANRVNVYGQWADKRSMPTNYGKTFKVSKFEHMYDRSLNDTEFGAKGFLSGRDYDTVDAFLNNTVDGAGLTEGAGAQNKRTLKKVTELSKKIGLIENPTLTKGFKLKAIKGNLYFAPN